jgi:hypothetical protein
MTRVKSQRHGKEIEEVISYLSLLLAVSFHSFKLFRAVL